MNLPNIMTATALDLQALHARCGGNSYEHNYILVSSNGDISVTPVRPDEESLLNGSLRLYSYCSPVLTGEENEEQDGAVGISLEEAEAYLQGLRQDWHAGHSGLSN